MLGEEVRTLDVDFSRMFIIDGKWAVLQDHVPREGEPDRNYAHLVSNSEVCAFLCALFERHWVLAKHWHGGRPGSSVTPRQRALLDLVGPGGLTIKQAASKMGLSERSLATELVRIREAHPQVRMPTLASMAFWWATHPGREREVPSADD
jgi:hypothetical protein